MRDPILALKDQLAAEIRRALGQLNQYAAARILGLDQPRMSNLLRNRLDRFSLEKLIRLLAILGRPVELRVPDGPPLRVRIPRQRSDVIHSDQR